MLLKLFLLQPCNGLEAFLQKVGPRGLSDGSEEVAELRCHHRLIDWRLGGVGFTLKSHLRHSSTCTESRFCTTPYMDPTSRSHVNPND